ncbi:unnamed protein product [Rhodiola kirilowii]
MARAATDSENTAFPAQLRFPTPSPFSVTSPLRSSSRHFVHAASLSNRAMAVILSFISALSLARPPKQRNSSQLSTSFIDHPELVYCFVVAILAFGYSALQLIRGIYDIAHRGFFVTEKVSDYTTFILDQLVAYLLISSCSVSIPVIQHLDGNSALRVAAWTSGSNVVGHILCHGFQRSVVWLQTL